VIYADILDMADPAIFNNNPEWFTTLTPDVIPDLEKYPKATDGKTGYGWLPKYALQRLNLATVHYNTNLVKDPPKAWTDLLDPKYKGKILLSSPKATPSYMGWAEQMREYYGIDYLKKLRAQEFKLVDSAEPGGQQVAAGAYMLNFPAAVTHSLALIKQGAPISRVVMNKPSSGPEQLIALVVGSAHPGAARLFLRFMLQPEIQNMICAITGTSTPLAGSGPGKAENCLPVPPDFVRLPYDRLGDKAVTQPLLDALGMQ
jgi:iron(III) transport system substrate-binding protein